jgi:hypothetical protein
MTLVPRFKSLLTLSAITLFALPTLAATRRHTVAIPPTITISGTVTDATNNQPVVSAEVSVGNVKGTADQEGKYSFKAKGGSFPISVTAARSGYRAVTQQVSAAADVTVNFSLQPTATVTVKEISGATTQIDSESFKFAYLVPFSGYISTDKANFCLADGTEAHPDHTEIVKITGPATPQTGTKCCNIGPVMSLQIAFRDGHTSTVYLTDSCFGNEVDVLGRSHTSGAFAYFNLANVAEIVLP